MHKTKITAVSYHNTKPFLYGLENSGLINDIELSLDIPSEGARKLLNDEVDIGLVPVAILPELGAYHIISDYCIGTTGNVDTVCLFSDVPIEQVERVFLDHHSRTSVMLTRILLQDYWQLTPELIPAQPGFESEIKGTTAGLVIGDRAIALLNNKPHIYDLGATWVAHAGLPFVFAAWISKQPQSPAFVTAFNDALKHGLDNTVAVAESLRDYELHGFDMERYLTQSISYQLDVAKREGLDRFLARISQMSGLAV